MRYDGTLITIQLLRYCYCMMLSNTASTTPSHSLGSQRPTATRGNWFPPRAIGGGVNLINMHRQRREVSWHVYAIQLQTTKTQSLRLIDLHARRWRSWR